LVVASVWLGPADSQDHWPFNSLTSIVLIFLVMYALLAMWVGGQQQDGKKDPDQAESPS
jgi:hypothetical protein